MFKALFKVQWKQSGPTIVGLMLVTFAVPLLSARGLVFPESLQRVTAADIVRTMQDAGPFYALLAGAAGLAAGFLAWNADQKGRHMYALSLPVTRARYALMRFGAGAVMLILPTLAVLLGSLVAIAIIQLPDGMHAYPISLTLRFLMASYVSYAIFFAIAGASQKSAAVLLGALGAFLVFSIVISSIDVRWDVFGKVGTLLFTEPGLLSVFTGRWMLIDV